MSSILDNHSFVVFMCIALAALAVVMAYAVFSRFTKQESSEGPVNNEEMSQGQYMREVRLRYQGSMANANGYGRKWMHITQNAGAGKTGHGHRDSEVSYM